MNEKHYKKNLSAFVNHELQGDERQRIAEHLLQCADCRSRHDQIKFGAALASNLQQADAPENLWNKIETVLDGREKTKNSFFPSIFLFGSNGLFAGVSLLLVCGLTAGIYFGLVKNELPETTKNEIAGQQTKTDAPQNFSASNDVPANQNLNAIARSPNSNSNLQVQTPNSNVQAVSPQIIKGPDQTIAARNNLPAWNVETLAGMPRAGSQTIAGKGKLAVGEVLETDANSRARVQVANIGQVEIAPNSRVQLVNTKATEHRLSLERGRLQAKILAPPRLFIVDTPSAVAVDLGCEYTLEVDKEGNSKLHVTSGFVALELGRRESIVPAGAIALTKKGKGLGTPFAEEASAELQNALYKFDFENGGREALQTIIKEANLYDSLTLWHLLSRVPKTERGEVFAALAARVAPPEKVTREGVLRLDKKMLEAWWSEIEQVWFG